MEAYIHAAQAEGDCFIIRFSGCDFKCRYCNVPDLVEFNTGELLETKAVIAAIDASGARKALFTGGEPLLQRQALLELLRHCRKKEMTTILDTNAAKPEALSILLREKLVDEYLVDIKASRSGFEKVTRSGTFFKPSEQVHDDVLTSLRALRVAKAVVSFKTLVTPGLIYRKEDLLEIAALLEGFDAQWTLAPFDPAVTLDPALRGVSPPTMRFLENLAQLMRKDHPKLRVSVEDHEPKSSE